MKDLTKKENWDETMIYIHRSRMIFGLFMGIILGVLGTLILQMTAILTQ